MITVVLADAAGNVGTASRAVTVVRSAPRISVVGKGYGLSAARRNGTFGISVKARLVRRAGLPASACRGKATISVRVGLETVASRSVRVGTSCRITKFLTGPAPRLKGAKVVRIVVTFARTATLAKASLSRSVTVR